ncbi:MAG: hypothetical protein WBA25_08205 [Jannaschia sp.]
MTAAAATWNWFAALDARIWQALIAGTFLAFGWVYNGMRNRADTRAQRAERLRDAHRAIFAEIAVNLDNLRSAERLDAHRKQMVARMNVDADYVPLIPHQRHDKLFRALEQEIHILPRVTIDPIVRYYSQMDAISAVIDDMRGQAYRRLPQARRIAMFSDYIDMRKQALEFGRIANSLIEIYAREGKDGAEAAARRFSSSVRDRSAT